MLVGASNYCDSTLLNFGTTSVKIALINSLHIKILYKFTKSSNSFWRTNAIIKKYKLFSYEFVYL